MTEVRVDVDVEDEAGNPLEGAFVKLYYEHPPHPDNFSDYRYTKADGRATFGIGPKATVRGVHVKPREDYWDMVADGPFNYQRVKCAALKPGLPAISNRKIAWWNREVGQHYYDPDAGRGIRIGILDTGLEDHEALRHGCKIGDFLPDTPATFDALNHGTHVAGLIGARPLDVIEMVGVAPAADLLVARVFDVVDATSAFDVAEAIDDLSSIHEADIINISLGAETKSSVVAQAIDSAFQRGTLCIAAAGNGSVSVNFPAALDKVVAVAAVGKLNEYPDGSYAQRHEPASAKTDFWGQRKLFFAEFNVRSGGINVIAPGVGLISTFRGPDSYYAMSGSSMASPVVCGVLACKLAVDQKYKSMPRNSKRAEMAREILYKSCRSVGLKPEFEGLGMPTI